MPFMKVFYKRQNSFSCKEAFTTVVINNTITTFPKK